MWSPHEQAATRRRHSSERIAVGAFCDRSSSVVGRRREGGSHGGLSCGAPKKRPMPATGLSLLARARLGPCFVAAPGADGGAVRWMADDGWPACVNGRPRRCALLAPSPVPPTTARCHHIRKFKANFRMHDKDGSGKLDKVVPCVIASWGCICWLHRGLYQLVVASQTVSNLVGFSRARLRASSVG